MRKMLSLHSETAANVVSIASVPSSVSTIADAAPSTVTAAKAEDACDDETSSPHDKSKLVAPPGKSKWRIVPL